MVEQRTVNSWVVGSNPTYAVMKCENKHCNNEIEPNTRHRKFCCIKCKNNTNVQLNRVRTKKRAVTYKGGKCEHCGYSKSVWALVFHHLDPTQKEFAVGGDGATKAWSKVQQEIDKCMLLCMNCHAEEHERLGTN